MRDLAAHVSDIHSLLGGKGLDLIEARLPPKRICRES